MRASTSIFVFFSGLVIAGLAQNASADATLSVKIDASSVTYHIVHKLHKVDGTSKKVEGKARIQAAGPTQVGLRIPIESFDSNNTNRDAHMKEATEAAKFPYVELKAAADSFTMPTTFPSNVSKTFKAQLTFHGVTQTMELPVMLKFESPDRVVATTSITVSLDAYKVERPSLMFVKIDDAMKVDVSITFAP